MAEDLKQIPLDQLVLLQGSLVTRLLAVNNEMAERCDALASLASELPGKDDNSDDFINAAGLAREMNEVLESALSELRGETRTFRS